MKDVFLTVDVGTTAIKVSAVEENFHMLTCRRLEYQLNTEGNKVTFPSEIYWEKTKQGIQDIIQQVGKEAIVGITVTTQGETLIPVDHNGKALYDAVVWLDGRAEKQGEKIRQLAGPDVFYQMTGIPECNGLCPVSKILWFLEEEPELYQKTAYFLLLEDYIIYKLTGFIVTEKSLLCTTGYFNMQTDEVWTELLVRAGIDPEKIPPAMDCGKMVGELSEEAVKETGLCAGTKVVTGAMDQVCGALGAGNDKAGELAETTGTALCIGKTIKSGPIHTTYQIPVYRHYRKELQLLLPVCMTAGLALKWFKDTFCLFETEKAARAGRDIYDILSDMAETSPPLAKGMIMLPYLAGSLQPYHAPEFRGGFHEVSLECGLEDFVRALMEGVCYMLKENLLLLDEVQSSKGNHMISMGGGARSSIWCQIKADVTGKKVIVREESETASIGAAMLCALGLGKIQSLDSARRQGEKEKVYFPEEERMKLYEKGYERYSRLLKKLVEEKC